jgi:hypothetical protein
MNQVVPISKKRRPKQDVCAIYIQNALFHQDRLGTNTGKTQKQDMLSARTWLGWQLSGHAAVQGPVAEASEAAARQPTTCIAFSSVRPKPVLANDPVFFQNCPYPRERDGVSHLRNQLASSPAETPLLF